MYHTNNISKQCAGDIIDSFLELIYFCTWKLTSLFFLQGKADFIKALITTYG